MGIVYSAEDMALRRRVAIKVLAPHLLDDSKARSRFQKEIKAAVAIEHPYVVPIYAAGYDNGRFFLVMRLVDGHDVKTELQRISRFDEQRGLRLLGQVTSALFAVHREGLVHRDVKPHNVLLGSVGEPDEHAQLTDFGIAKALDDSTILTGVGAIGTPAYMAPEVCLGQSASAASDQYSLACMAYEMFAGAPPFDGSADPRQAHGNEEPPPLRELAPDLRPEVAAAIDRGLAKNPADRFADVRQLVLVDPRSRQSFDQATAVTEVIRQDRPTEEVVKELAEVHGLSDATIAAVSGFDTARVARIRRRAARQALVGPPSSGRGRRRDGIRKD
jgi:serine/threonine-protein kinase